MVDRNQFETVFGRLLDKDIAIVSIKIEDPGVEDSNLVHFVS